MQDLQDKTHPYTPGAEPGPETYLLVWDLSLIHISEPTRQVR